MSIIFLEPVLQEKIWGGSKLRDNFGFNIPSENTGEAWIISAHKNGVSKVKYPKKFEGMGLDEVYKNNKGIFGSKSEEVFPLLVKLLDSSDDLSVQVHPDDKYASENEGIGELGKTECWYIIDADDDSEIIFGHNAHTREEFYEKIKNGQWDSLLKRVKVNKGDFFYVPNGTVHAIGKGIMILEIQQSSDTTYRLYDYDRVDSLGNKRELHIEKSLDVITIPHVDMDIMSERRYIGENKITTLIETDFFDVYKYLCKDKMMVNLLGDYNLCTVINGRGQIKVGNEIFDIEKSDSFIITNEVRDIELHGELEIIISNK